MSISEIALNLGLAIIATIVLTIFADALYALVRTITKRK